MGHEFCLQEAHSLVGETGTEIREAALREESFLGWLSCKCKAWHRELLTAAIPDVSRHLL